MSDTPSTNPSAATQGLRYDGGKARTDLLCPIAMMGTARVLAKGARKYAAWNWAKGMPWSKVIGSLLRHTFKLMLGEDYDIDPDCKGCQQSTPTDWVCVDHTGELHVDCIGCNAMFLQNYARNKKDLDDRFKGALGQ